MICAAKPRYTAASTREHLRFLAPRLVAPSTPIASPFHAPGEIILEMSQRRVLWARIKGEARCKRAVMRPKSRAYCCEKHDIALT